ncbi:MAG: ATP-binding protein [Roseateles sp.]|uniref:ATP-binding protein n=1 Tax=Roseateles sp. TaxID=1971397 RepID=UPI0040361872
MSLRIRLLLMIGGALVLLWGAVAFWLHGDSERQMQRMLDDRLVTAAYMVSDLVTQNPSLWTASAGPRPALQPVLSLTGPLACQVSSARGEILVRTAGASGALLDGAAAGFAFKSIEGLTWRTYTVNTQGLAITTAERVAERSTLLKSVVLAAVAPFGAALLGGLLVLWWGVGKALQPLERLRGELAARAIDELAPVAAGGRPRELRPFVDTVNEMLARIRATVQRERRFTSDAAHELRTPLTAIKVHLQVLRLSEGDDALRALDHADEGVARLQAALSQLLMLSQLEAHAGADGPGHTAVADVVALAVRDCAPAGDLRLQVFNRCEEAAVAVPEALAVTALRNLLDNACRHTPADGCIRLHVDCLGGNVRMTVADTGPGLDDEGLATATERFWRRGTGTGSGLGLSITQAVCERFGGSLTLERSDEGGLLATVSLPQAVISNDEETQCFIPSP